MGTLED